MNDSAAPVVVYVAPNRMAAEVVRARLASYGIEAALQYEAGAQMLGLYIDGWGETRVLVPAERAEEARELLSDTGSEPTEE